MIRLSRLCDYAVAMLTHLALRGGGPESAAEIAAATGVPPATASKILKLLARGGILVSQRGVQGGYALARPAEAISVAEIVEAVDGPIALTTCIDDADESCGIATLCPARGNWQRINDAIRAALGEISLAEMAHAVPEAFLDPHESLSVR